MQSLNAKKNINTNNLLGIAVITLDVLATINFCKIPDPPDNLDPGTILDPDPVCTLLIQYEVQRIPFLTKLRPTPTPDILIIFRFSVTTF